MEELKTQHPEVAAHLEGLPEHIVDHLGSKALQLTHEDMHPQVEKEGQYGETRLEIDIENVITDPEYDSSKMEADAVAAAERGEQKIADILMASAHSLRSAHDQLVESGMSFGAEGLETDEARDKREAVERDSVYEAAMEQAVATAVQSREEGKTEQSVQALESLIVLRYVQDTPSRAAFRSAVKAGLGHELLAAAEASAKLYTGNGYDNIGNHLFGAEKLLEFATGTDIEDFSFATNGEFNLDKHRYLIDDETIKDLFAALASPGSAVSTEQGLGMLNNRIGEDVQALISPDAVAGEYGSIEYFDGLVERCGELRDMQELLKCSNPEVAMDAMDKLSITATLAVFMLGRAENYGDPIVIDQQALEGMVEFKAKYPEHFTALADKYFQSGNRSQEGGGIGYDPRALVLGLDILSEAGIDNPDIVARAEHADNPVEYAEGCKRIADKCHEMDMSFAELPELAKKSGIVFKSIENASGEDIESLEMVLSNVRYRAQLHDVAMAGFEALEYPLSEKAKPKVDVRQLTYMQERVKAQGIPDEVATEMLESWASYSAYAQYFYNKEEGIALPEKSPDEAELEHIIERQIMALETQLDAFENFCELYGPEQAQEVINEFGIYNFSRHQPEKLMDQYERWMKGEPASTVVVEARADWNSFTGKKVQFEEESGDGVFYFEANSGAEIARRAVMIGRREREHGREPNVERFIIHAHGNPNGMLIGVQGQWINTEGYQEAAEKSEKINPKEVNDYRRHLGEDFEVILQSCSTAGDNEGARNIAQTMKDAHNAPTVGYDNTIFGIKINKQGEVTFETDEGDGSPIIYEP